jgi:hypothetical protein
MTTNRSRKRRKRVLDSLLATGLGLFALGLVFLIAPRLMGSTPALKSFTAGLGLASWFALAAGLALIGLYRFAKAMTTQAGPLPERTPSTPASMPTQAQRDIKDQVAWHKREPTFVKRVRGVGSNESG